ncbi:MAG: DUF4236 domain-containing protein [Alphaproteobacteria bacterium]|nr:DUF4236 domain-containing protein [Alphaproteobacteria bacterium]
MGFIFRKSFNLGPLRINFSKHGIGWSFGVPGYRRTTSATGKKRTTYSIPGTGISWVEHGKSGKKTNKTKTIQE